MTSSTGRLVLIAWGLALAIALGLLIPITARAQTVREVDLSQVPPDMRPAFVDAIGRMPPDFLDGRALAVVSMRLEQNWALATLAVQDASLEDNGMGANGALVILRGDEQGGWQAGIEGTPDYDKLVPVAPEVLISAPAKRIMMVPGPAAPDIAAMKFPWDSSQNWYLTQGWHYGNHVDFAPARAEPNKWVLAAHAGTVTRVCVGDVSANLQLRHSDGTITTYSHFDKNEVVTPTLGSYVPQGRILGKLYNSNFSQDGCGYSSGPHVHFGVPTQTVTVDGWTADSANNWTRDGVVKHEGDRFSSSNVRNEGAPIPPGAFGKLSPTNGATGQLTALTLDWGDSANATSYEYCVDSTNNNLCDSTWVSVGSNTAAVVNNLTPQVTYYWQVRALSAAGTTAADGDTWWSFTTQVLAPFGDAGAPFDGVKDAAAAWGDYDGDGDLDLVVVGFTGTQALTQLYNSGAGGYSVVNGPLAGGPFPGVSNGALAWGDYDRDGDLDLLLQGYGNGYLTALYRNDGAGFSAVDVPFVQVANGTLAWGDYDNDGDLDVLLTGDNGMWAVARIYRNDGDRFSDIAAPFTGVGWGSPAAWGDYDDDGDLDVVLAGSTGPARVAYLYRNDQGHFANSGVALAGVSGGALAWGDYDNDGDLDLLLAGWVTGSGAVTKLYRNNGAGGFSAVSVPFAGVYGQAAAAWGDYDNDGDPDVLIAGDAGMAAATVYRNDGGQFVDAGIALDGVRYGAVATWVDDDHDGDLDVLLAGQNAQSKLVTRLYRNAAGFQANTPPGAPGGLSATVAGHTVTLQWNAASDARTPQAALSYNLWVSRAQGTFMVASPLARLSDGRRQVVGLGNAGMRQAWTLRNLPAGDYTWSVQALDSAYAGSVFATQGHFHVDGPQVFVPFVMR